MKKNFEELLKNARVEKVNEVMNSNNLKGYLKPNKKVIAGVLCGLVVFGGYKASIYSSYKYTPMTQDSFANISQSVWNESDGNVSKIRDINELKKLEKNFGKLSKSLTEQITQTTTESGLESFYKESDDVSYHVSEMPTNKYGIKYALWVDLNMYPDQAKINKDKIEEVTQVLRIMGLNNHQSKTIVNMLAEQKYVNSLKPLVYGSNDKYIFEYNADQQSLHLFIK